MLVPMSSCPVDDSAEWASIVASSSPLPAHWKTIDLTLSQRRAALLLGLKDSDVLRGWLRERNLPPYLTLRNWYYVTLLVEQAERGSLAQWALDRHHDPATYYRFVERTTSTSWTIIRDEGLDAIRRRALHVWRPWRRN